MDHPDYKYQPRRKKIKTMNGSPGNVDEKQQHPTPPPARKSGRRSKKQLDNEEIDDNDSDRSGYTSGCMNYNNYDNHSSAISNYSAFSSYMPQTTAASLNVGVHDGTKSSPSSSFLQNNYNDFYSNATTRKYECHTMQNKIADSPHSSTETEEHSVSPPETSISSTISSVTAANGNFRELSPSLITSHSIMKEDYANECSYRPTSAVASSTSSGIEQNSKDFEIISKYNQESYRIYSHQLHHHHHYHYSLQSPTQGGNSTTSSGSINYPYQPYSSATGAGIDTDVDVEEMEQYLDNGKYRKYCYLKPENSLTELTPMNTTTSTLSEGYHHHQAMSTKVDNENIMQMPSTLDASQSSATYGNNYQENINVPSSVGAYAPYISGNWVNYSI